MDAGGSFAVQPGGMMEQSQTRHDQEQAFFPANLGFIRMAIKYGTPLLILYVFGENQLFQRSGATTGKRSMLTNIIKQMTGMTFPIIKAKFGIPMAMVMPIKTDIHARWGAPVEVGPPEENPSDERVEEVFRRYLEELQHVFYSNAHDCLPPEVAARGLKIVRSDGKPVPEFRGKITGGRSRL
jgi:2-acylglycerol O-acyltransferase 2